jgi:hypothetical protein
MDDVMTRQVEILLDTYRRYLPTLEIIPYLRCLRLRRYVHHSEDRHLRSGCCDAQTSSHRPHSSHRNLHHHQHYPRKMTSASITAYDITGGLIASNIASVHKLRAAIAHPQQANQEAQAAGRGTILCPRRADQRSTVNARGSTIDSSSPALNPPSSGIVHDNGGWTTMGGNGPLASAGKLIVMLFPRSSSPPLLYIVPSPPRQQHLDCRLDCLPR